MAIVKNNKSNMTYVSVMVIISVITFLVYILFFGSLWKSAVSEKDDIMCRAYVVAKDLKVVKAGEFFWNLKQRCKVDPSDKIDLTDEDKSFQVLANKMSRCWFRYGEGQYDFLSNFDTEGNWCFLCSSVEFEKNSASVPYKDFVEWSNNHKYNDSMSYFEYFNIKYADVDDKELESIREEFNVLLNDEDAGASAKEMLYVLGEQINYLDDLRFKQIDSSDDKLYVVYRYDRVDKSFEKKLADASDSMKYGIYGSVVVSVLAEGLTEAAVTGAVGAVVGGTGGSIVPVAGTGIGAIVGGAVGGVVGFGKGIVKGIVETPKAFYKVFRVGKLIERVGQMIKTSSKLITKADEAVELTRIVVKGEEEIKIAKRIEAFEASAEDLRKFAEIAREAEHADVATKLDELVKLMDEFDIKSVSDIDNKIYSNVDELEKLRDFVDKSDNILDSQLETLAKQEGGLVDNIGDLEALRELAKKELSDVNVNAVNSPDPVGLRNYLRVFVVVGSGIGGGAVGYNYNDNYVQYVDIMTQEQYYRLCGTERLNDK